MSTIIIKALNSIIASVDYNDLDVRNKTEDSADLYYEGKIDDYEVGQWWYDEDTKVWHFDIRYHLEGELGATDWASDATTLEEAIDASMSALKESLVKYEWDEQEQDEEDEEDY